MIFYTPNLNLSYQTWWYLPYIMFPNVCFIIFLHTFLYYKWSTIPTKYINQEFQNCFFLCWKALWVEILHLKRICHQWVSKFHNSTYFCIEWGRYQLKGRRGNFKLQLIIHSDLLFGTLESWQSFFLNILE